jgi:filamentous hemagglutinin family protein
MQIETLPPGLFEHKCLPSKHKPLSPFAAFAILAILCNVPPQKTCANPQGPVVSQGSASVASAGSQLTVRTSDQAFINWQSFNIGLGETTTFIQPSSSSVVWNRINDGNPSQILGNLKANGYVFLQNSSGFFIGAQASIEAHGLVMTTSPIPMPDLSSGSIWNFNAVPPTASIINYGQIAADHGGSVYLIAHHIDNQGTIIAPEGEIGLHAGQEVLVCERPDGRGLSAKVTLPNGSVDNSGKLVADAGTIAVNAQVVNQGGVIQANSIREANGVIELVASECLTLSPSSQVSAHGGAEGVSSGGTVTLKSGGSYSDSPSSSVDVSGGAQGGNGGQLEVSAPRMGSILSRVEGGSLSLWQAGRVLIDPLNVLLSASGSTAPGSGVVNAGDPPDNDTLVLNVNSFSSFSQIIVQALHNIELATLWKLPDSQAPASLTLQAGQNLTFDAGAGISAGRNWTLNLTAGADFSTPRSVIPGTGDITLNGTDPLKTLGPAINLTAGEDINLKSAWTLGDALGDSAVLAISAGNNVNFTGSSLALGRGWNLDVDAGTKFGAGSLPGTGQGGIYVNDTSVRAANGNIDLQAYNEIKINRGGVTTTSGGSIVAEATVGSITTGTGSAGYAFGTSGYAPSLPLGGISTGAGGDVTLIAGQDIISFPAATVSTGDPGSGAFATDKPGIVSVTAGRDVTGHFVAGDSVDAQGNPVASTITAGLNAGRPGALLSLSLVKGGWSVAANSIDLQEVRNPNGVFNSQSGAMQHLFDYDPLSFVNLFAANSVELNGSSVPRGDDAVNVVYPPTLKINAGAGGVIFDADVTLFPSSLGNLSITTTDGGSVFSRQSASTPQAEAGILFSLIMSDTDERSWTGEAFGGGHAAKPVHIGDLLPVSMDISGNISDLNIVLPKPATINVHGSLENSSFAGQNLSPNDVTSITVSGRIYDRSDVTYEQLETGLPQAFDSDHKINTFIANLFDASGNRLFSPASTPAFAYNATTHQLAFTGHLTADVAAKLTGPLYQAQVDSSGRPLINPLTGKALAVIPVNFVDPGIINYFVEQTKDLPNPNLGGLSLAGPGTFRISASSMTLGDPQNQGISSVGASINSSLLAYGRNGANLDITTTVGDLNMFASTINTLMGGNITVNCAGSVELGTQETFGFSAPNRGVYTVAGGDVAVKAVGDINLYGSRIATFDGGNIAVTSTAGSVDAGNGTSSDIAIVSFLVDPATGQLTRVVTIFNGSGIQALTLPLQLTALDDSGHQVVLHTDPNAQPGNIDVNAYRNITASQGGIVQEPLNGNAGAGPTVTLTAGTRDASGKVVSVGNIDLSGAGVIGGSVKVDATGSATGLVIGRQDINITAVNNFSGTVLSGGTANISAGGTVSGTVIGVSGVSVGGGATVTANLLSTSVSVGGGQSQSTLGAASASATSTAAAGTASSDFKEQATSPTAAQRDEDLQKKKLPLLTRRVSRVTVLLPN